MVKSINIVAVSVLSILWITASEVLSCDVFNPARIGEWPVDSCAYTGGGPEDCSDNGKRFAANSFCKSKGYSYAAKWWETNDSIRGNYIARATFNGGYEFIGHKGGSNIGVILCR